MNIRDYFTTIKEKLSGNGTDYQFLLNIAIILLVNIAAVNLNVRMDLTRNNTYSITDKSKEVVSTLKENMKVKVLFSSDLPAEHGNILRYLKDILQEYSYHGNSFFSYEIVDEDELEKQARDYGIQPVSSREFKQDQVQIRRTYMAVVIQHADLLEKIPALADPVGLEYAITSRMEKMSAKIDGLLSLEKPITMTLFLDGRLKQLPIDGISKIGEVVKEAVDKSNKVNYGKIKLREIDPSVDKKMKDVAARYGLQLVRWGKGRTPDGKRMDAGEGVLGIVFENGSRFQTIELNVMPAIMGNYVVVGLEKIEDKINNAVGALLSAGNRIGYLSGHGVPDLKDERSRNGAALLKQILQDKYELVAVDAAKGDISADINVLIVAGPKDKLLDLELFRIDQFLMKGKKVIFLLDSFQEIQMPRQQNPFARQQPPMVLPVNTGLDAMLKSYGVTVSKNIVLDTNCIKVNQGQMIIDYPLVPKIQRDNMSRESVITRYLGGALFLKASSLKTDAAKLKEKGVKVTKLVASSDESWLMTGRMNFNPMMMRPDPAAEKQSYDLALLLSGKFSSFFKGKEVPLSDEKKKKKTGGKISTHARLDESVKSGKPEIIVVGTAELARSGFLADSRKVLSKGKRNEAYSNDNLVHGMVDYMAGNFHVPEMLAKSLEFNPFDEPTEKNTSLILKTVNMAGVPIVVIILGIIMWRFRIRRKNRIAAQFGGGLQDE